MRQNMPPKLRILMTWQWGEYTEILDVNVNSRCSALYNNFDNTHVLFPLMKHKAHLETVPPLALRKEDQFVQFLTGGEDDAM